MKTPLRLAPASQILADFIAAPVGMRPAQHLTLIRDLHAGLGVRAALTPGNRTVSEWQWEDHCEGQPWHDPIYAVEPTTGIGILELNGPLVKGYDDLTCWAYGAASIDKIARSLHEIEARTDIRALVVVINSPGGMSTGMPELADQLAALASQRLVVTHTSDMAASNGMRLAVAGTRFFPTASATVGCIGTYIALYDYTAYLEEMGIKLELYRAGKYKAIGLPGKATNDEEKTFIQAEVDRSNAYFLDFVRARRPGVAAESMEGQWFDGARAVEYGLADRTVTGLPEVLREVAAALA